MIEIKMVNGDIYECECSIESFFAALQNAHKSCFNFLKVDALSKDGEIEVNLNIDHIISITELHDY